MIMENRVFRIEGLGQSMIMPLIEFLEASRAQCEERRGRVLRVEEGFM
jgi:hypothetical protein